MQLYDDQERAISLLRESLKRGNKRPVLQAPVAFGKTILSAEIIKLARQKRQRVIFTAPAISLIDQTVDKFANYGISGIGVIQANHPLTDYDQPVQVASVRTLMRRTPPEAGMVIIDEAHLCFEFIYKWMQKPGWESVPFIGLSATPWVRGMGKYWDDLIVAATMRSQEKKGRIAKMRYLAPDIPDLTGIKTVRGDYDNNALSERMSGRELLAQSVENWIEHGEGRPTIAFCVDRAHATQVQERFNSVNVPCGYIDAHTTIEERQEIGKQLESGALKVVSSVGCLIVGLDWTFVSCILHCRPTKSHMLFVQSVGRGVRGDECLVIDCAGNFRLGHPYDIHFTKLCDGTPRGKSERKEAEERIREVKVCSSCKAIKPIGEIRCPECGFEPKPQTDVTEQDNSLFEIDGSTKKKLKRKKPEDYSTQERMAWFRQLRYLQLKYSYKEKWAEASFKDKFSQWPSFDWPTYIEEPSPEVMGWYKNKMIRYAKRRAKNA